MTGANIAYESSLSTAPLMTEWMAGPIKFELRNSLNSPLSTQFDSETCSSLNSNQEQYSSPGNLSEFSTNSSLEYNNSFHQVSPSPTNFSDTLQFSSGESSGSQDPNYHQSMKYVLHEIETALMGPDGDDEGVGNNDCTTFGGNKQPDTSTQQPRSFSEEPGPESYNDQAPPSFTSRDQYYSYVVQAEKRHRMMQASSPENPQCNLKRLLIECAKSLSEERNDFNKLIEDARSVVSISGEPIQRLGAYFVEGLVARKEKSGTNIYRALNCRQPESKELLSYMGILYEICPYLKFGYMAANGAIAEAFKNEDHVHIVDFQIGQGTQWTTLIEALAARTSGPPYMRVTGIDDPVSKYARGGSLQAVGERLAAMSKKFNIPIEFHAVPAFALDVTCEMLDVRPGEALAVNFPLQLHHTPDESIDVNNPRDGMLRMVRSLSPKVVTLIEQESNTNTTPFLTRFVEALDFYSAMFESIDVTMPRDSKDRISVEQQCLARDMVNVIACEGKERVERHELLGKWKSRFTMAGFQPFPLSSHVNHVIRGLLRGYSEHYTLVEKDGAMLLGWKDRNLVSASAWH
ncbi:Scarecrow-like transcription factor pat1 [Thalictrum thalictroides]|uniref:Scarecrow-like transcription factor pat1 n=1 Tax=Thalictrum thalictroides TaxID=46969 RepID=A0A7J6VG81_THATH|nr:Scarecrow-like transcription factor pat1 [Thalictrum thalictroides]